MRNARVSASRLDQYRAKFPTQETELFDEICIRRADGKRVSCEWIQRQMRHLVMRDKPDGYEQFTASNMWRSRFFRRFVLSVRSTTNTKPHTAEERIKLVHGFHKAIKTLAPNPSPSFRKQKKWKKMQGYAYFWPIRHPRTNSHKRQSALG